MLFQQNIKNNARWSNEELLLAVQCKYLENEAFQGQDVANGSRRHVITITELIIQSHPNLNCNVF